MGWRCLGLKHSSGLRLRLRRRGDCRRGSGGVSSFGYSGTIAHAVLAFGSGDRDALAFGSRGAEAAGEGVGAAGSTSAWLTPESFTGTVGGDDATEEGPQARATRGNRRGRKVLVVSMRTST